MNEVDVQEKIDELFDASDTIHRSEVYNLITQILSDYGDEIKEAIEECMPEEYHQHYCECACKSVTDHAVAERLVSIRFELGNVITW
jgi:hypothetical protein